MKTFRKQLNGLFIVGGFVALSGFIHAQVATTPLQPVASSPSSDSAVQIAADESGLSLLDPTSVANLGPGTYWITLDNQAPVPYPFLPPQADPATTPIYGFGFNSEYLVDLSSLANGAAPQATGRQAMAATTAASAAAAVQNQLNAVLSVIDLVQSAQVSAALNAAADGQMTAMDAQGPPSPGDGGSSTNTGGTPLFSPPAVDYGTNTCIIGFGMVSNTLVGIVSNTLADVSYEIQYVTNLNNVASTQWLSAGFVLGSELTNWTALALTNVAATNNMAFFRIRSWQDDGSGLPLWWQAEYFGVAGGVDPNGDPMGDGWSNIEKFQNGMDPNVFYTPPTPQGLIATYNASSGTVTVSWLPSPGSVTGYILSTPSGTVYPSASATSYTYSDAALGPFLTYPDLYYGSTTFDLAASYAGGNSPNASTSLAPYSSNIGLLEGTQGSNFLAVSALPPGTTAIRLIREDWVAASYGDASFNVSNDIPLSSFSNGVCYIPAGLTTSPVDAYGNWQYFWSLESIGPNGGANSSPVYLGNNSVSNANYGVIGIYPLYADGRVQMKEDLIFQLRAAMVDFTLGYYLGNYDNEFVYPAYVYSGFYQTFDSRGQPQAAGTFDPFLPFENNYFYRNFVFSLSDVNQGFPTTGIWGGYTPYLAISNSPVTYQFQPPNVSGSTFPPLLSAADARWLGAGTYLYGTTWEYSPINEIGMSVDADSFYHLGGSNYFGLPFRSVEIAYPLGSGTATTELDAGSSTQQGGCFYIETAQPIFQTVEYDFWNANSSALPGTTGFALTNTSDLFIAPVGNQFVSIAGYAKLALRNGNPGVYGYLGQYFDQAYTEDANGVATTNSAGILSPYGQFFATQPGPAAFVTMPDPDTGMQGTCTVYCVSLNVDKNHDGTMDLSWNGPDATSPSSPYVFWVNNNYDRWHTVDGNDAEQDDLSPALVAGLNVPAEQKVPDYQYVTNGLPAIPCTRDLEDYFRFWTPGVAALMKILPANYTVQLTLTGDGQIRIFQAVEPNGGTNYLFNETTASNKVAQSASLYVGLLTSSSPIVFNITTNFNEHFIFCGAQTGSAQVDLQVLDGNQNIVADASAYLQINDIKQMYERWTVGDTPSGPILTNALAATEDLPLYTSAFRYTAPTDTNTPYILFVHGWNVDRYDKDRFAEAAFKRLYWQGYQGRFGSFRWPTYYAFPGGEISWQAYNPQNFDNSESNAWASAVGLLNKLNDLDAVYPGNVYLMAHSMGNVVAGEALRLAGGSQPVNSYIAMQGAIASHAYDPTTPTRSLGIYDSGTPNGYAQYPTNGGACYFNASAGAGAYVNFYNTNDYALETSSFGWTTDQNTKPDLGYGWDGTHFYSGVLFHLYLLFPIDTYAIFSYCDEARCHALGAQADVGGQFTVARQVDLQSVFPPDTHVQKQINNLPYSAHVWHSAEFRSDNPSRAVFWQTVLGVDGFNLK